MLLQVFGFLPNLFQSVGQITGHDRQITKLFVKLF